MIYGKVMILILDNPSEHFINHMQELVIREKRSLYDDDIVLKTELCLYDLKIKIREREVYVKDKLIHLNHLEYDTLIFLASHPGQVLSKEQIYVTVWKLDSENCQQSVINIIYQLRKKLEPNPTFPIFIKTVIGVGYKFINQGE